RLSRDGSSDVCSADLAQSAHGQGSCRLPAAKVARAETGPAAEGAGEAARILEPELVGNPRQRTGRVGHQAQGGVATYLIQQAFVRSEEHTSELQSRENLVCRLLLEKKKSGRRTCS